LSLFRATNIIKPQNNSTNKPTTSYTSPIMVFLRLFKLRIVKYVNNNATQVINIRTMLFTNFCFVDSFISFFFQR